MCIRYVRNYFRKLDEMEKIQTKGMEKAIDRSKDISEAYLQGGKAIGEIIRKKPKKK
jgi:hypothetical protein